MYSSEKMCTSSEMIVTITTIAATRPSTCDPIGHFTPPMSNQLTDLMIGATTGRWDSPSASGAITERPKADSKPSWAVFASSTCWIHWNAVQTDSTNDAPMAAMPISEPLKGIRLPKRMINQNEMAGMSGMSHACSMNHMAQPFMASSSLRAMLRRFR